jgi:hypothetical protein
VDCTLEWFEATDHPYANINGQQASRPVVRAM